MGEAGQDPDRRGLAGPVRAEQAEDGAARDVEVEAVEREHRAKPLREAADADRRLPGSGNRRHVSSRPTAK
jgi:hypothetical protein